MPARQLGRIPFYTDAGSKLGGSRIRWDPGLIRMDGFFELTGFCWLAPVNYHLDNQGRRLTERDQGLRGWVSRGG